MGQPINPDLLAQICEEIEEECSTELTQRALDLVKGHVPKDEEIWTAMGMLAVALGVLHARLIVRNLPPDQKALLDHARSCESCREEMAEAIMKIRWGGDTLGGCVDELAVGGAVLELARKAG